MLCFTWRNPAPPTYIYGLFNVNSHTERECYLQTGDDLPSENWCLFLRTCVANRGWLAVSTWFYHKLHGNISVFPGQHFLSEILLAVCMDTLMFCVPYLPNNRSTQISVNSLCLKVGKIAQGEKMLAYACFL